MVILTALSLAIWLYLVLCRGRFWRTDEQLHRQDASMMPAPEHWPDIAIIIPARDEVETIWQVITSHLQTTYQGNWHVFLVDDQSTDGTANLAQAAANTDNRLTIVETSPLPEGWSGKLWALHHGIQAANTSMAAKYFLLTDADIVHAPQTLASLVTQAEHQQLSLVSLMARLDARGLWGSILIPAFIFFFMKLYPFRWNNQPDNRLAAAAGGCCLVNTERLSATGGIETFKNALIDDCALARQIKNTVPRHPISLELADREVVSIRDNRKLTSIWTMVARTAYTQLDYSPFKLIGTVIGMILIYLIPALGILTWPWHGDFMAGVLASLTLTLMLVSYTPTMRLYGGTFCQTLSLPVAGMIYTIMTIHSATRHWQGRGGRWKGRHYSEPPTTS